jgi:hypothetical protein
MSAEIQHYYKSCTTCHSRRNPARRLRHELGQRPAVWAPFQRPSCNYVSVCTSERGFDNMLVFTDSLTHWVEAFPTQGATAKNAATLLYDKIICRYGCPKELLSNNGWHFANAVIDELTRVMGVCARTAARTGTCTCLPSSSHITQVLTRPSARAHTTSCTDETCACPRTSSSTPPADLRLRI